MDQRKELLIKCAICDKEISDKEIDYNDDMKAFEPCGTCLSIAMDAAYSGGFSHDDEVSTLIDDDLFVDSSEIPLQQYLDWERRDDT